jgi:ferredoxin
MNALQNKAAEWLENGTVSRIIGFCRGSEGPVPCFIDKAEEADQLLLDTDCRNNLSAFLHKAEAVEGGAVGIVAPLASLRSMVQLLSENQLGRIDWKALTLDPEGNVVVLSSPGELEAYVQAHFALSEGADTEALEAIKRMSREERWAYWKEQLSACIKCYACRAVCPMCYCTQCTVECNQPQWIKTSAETSGNFEWHAMRAMHLAGRCTQCGACSRACPAGIPVHLLTAAVNADIEETFDCRTGYSLTGNYALNAFRADDKEHFIK